MISLFGRFPRKRSIFQEKNEGFSHNYGRVYLDSKRMIFRLRIAEMKFVTYNLALSHWLTQSACATSCINYPMGGTDLSLALVYNLIVLHVCTWTEKHNNTLERW